MKRFVRTILRTGQDSDVWPVLWMLLAVLAPAVCLLWFMGAAMRNERLAAREKLAEIYRAQLSTSRARLQQRWSEMTMEIEQLARTNPAPVAFEKSVQSGFIDAVILFDAQGHISYPNAPSAVSRDFAESDAGWQEASRLESLRRYAEAAKHYDALARAATNVHAAARAFQSEARCLVRAGQNETAIHLVDKLFADERYREVADPQGRLIAANAELMALELITNRTSPLFHVIAQRLAARLADYDNPALAAPQRLFLMTEVQRLAPGRMKFPTFAAEQLAAEVCRVAALFAPANGENGRAAMSSSRRPPGSVSETMVGKDGRRAEDSVAVPTPAPTGASGRFALRRSTAPGLWQFIAPNHRVLALVGSDKLSTTIETALASDNLPADVRVSLMPPEADSTGAFVTLPAGEPMPGWRLALSFKDQNFLNATAGRQTVVYVWTAILVVAGMSVLTAIALRFVRRQMALARLKNDLAATVSHELKTPLSSMRVLVETLLDAEKFDEPKTREYLRLIAQENERLGRLIQNFLTFSRMERKKHTFQFLLLPVGRIVDAAVASVRARFDVPGCRLEVQIEEDLPPVMADADALTTALINLLENAWKYSEDIKHIAVCARAKSGRVIISVADNGIGIAPRERRKIFQPFYQTDQRLSRKGGGCGLGLSIVQFIVEAHRGSVSVESEPGQGSTFMISIPAAADVAAMREEAIA